MDSNHVKPNNNNGIAENMNAGKQTEVILLDFAKAFDKVPHMHLCLKLSHLGINGHLLEAFYLVEHNK